MANTKISALTALTGADLANDDAFAVVDTSATATKKITVAELKLGIMPAPGPIGATTPSTGAFTTLSATGNAGLHPASGSAAIGALRLAPGDGNNVIDFGLDTATGQGWIQGVDKTDYTTNRQLNLSPNGGGVSVGGALAVTGTISATSIITPGTFTTGTLPAKTLGGIIFDTTLNKLLIGGVSAWEVVTSI